jgi:hypothetical protein
LYCSLHIWGNVHALGAQRPMMVISIPKRVLGNWRQKTRFVQFSFCFCWVLLLFSMVSPICACIAECNAFLQFTHSNRNWSYNKRLQIEIVSYLHIQLIVLEVCVDSVTTDWSNNW